MRRVIKKSAFIKAVIIITALVLLVSAWPLKCWNTKTKVINQPVTNEISSVINYRNTATQVFVANAGHLDYIDVYVDANSGCDHFTAVLCNQDNVLIATQEVEVVDSLLPGYVHIEMDVDLNKEELYTLKFTSVKSLYLGEEPWNNPEQIAVCYYNTDLHDGRNIIMNYGYSDGFDFKHLLFFICAVILVMLILLNITEVISNKAGFDTIITVEVGIKALFNPIIVIFMLFSYVCIFMGKVSPYLPDKLFAILGVTSLGLVLIYIINHDRTGEKDILTKDYILENIPAFCQSIAIAMAIQAACEYASSLYDIHHMVASRKEIIWILVVMITMFEAQEIFNTYNLIFVLVSAAAGFFYCRSNITETMTELEHFVFRGNVYIFILAGIVFIRLIRMILAKKWSGVGKITLPLGCSLGLFLLLSSIFSNGRSWVPTFTVCFVVMVYFYLNWDSKNTLYMNLIRAVVGHFCILTIWCWLYRPYCTYRCTRYTHYFHTVTITATYLTSVAAVALVMLLVKIRRVTMVEESNRKYGVVKSFKLKDVWKELLFFSVVMVYLIFTMSRTAYAAFVAMYIFMVVMLLVWKCHGGFGIALKTTGWALLGIVILLPAVFEIQRTVPCLVSEPYQYEIDGYRDDVMRGRRLASTEYMMVGSLGDIFAEKILGIEDSGLESYFIPPPSSTEYTATVEELFVYHGLYIADMDISDDVFDEIGKNVDYIYERYVNGPEWTPDNPVNLNEVEVVTEAEGAASGESIAEAVDEGEDNRVNDYTNGRLGIYATYINNLNLTGHEEIGPILDDGEMATHAHDVYLEVGYEHGVLAMIAFVIFGIVALVTAILNYAKDKNDKAAILAVAIIISYAVAGVVEWLYNIGHPSHLMLMFIVIPILVSKKEVRK